MSVNRLIKGKSWLIALVLVLVFWERLKSAFFGSGLSSKLDDRGSDLQPVEARSITEALFTAMHGDGTNEQVIYDSLVNLTAADYAKVHNMFGKRKYVTLFKTYYWTLSEWIIEELTTSELAHLNSINPRLDIGGFKR